MGLSYFVLVKSEYGSAALEKQHLLLCSLTQASPATETQPPQRLVAHLCFTRVLLTHVPTNVTPSQPICV